MFVCPFCGEMIDDDVKACPHCGSDEQTGWKSSFQYEDEYDMDAETSERQSDSRLNFKKHPLLASGFFLFVIIIIGLFLYRYVL